MTPMDLDCKLEKSLTALMQERQLELKQVRSIETTIARLKKKLHQSLSTNDRNTDLDDKAGHGMNVDDVGAKIPPNTSNTNDPMNNENGRKRERIRDSSGAENAGKPKSCDERDLKRNRNFFNRAIQGTLKKFVYVIYCL